MPRTNEVAATLATCERERGGVRARSHVQPWYAACDRASMLSAAEFIGQHKHEILEAWHAVASGAASARGLEAPAFRNLMPTYIFALADAADDLGSFSAKRRKHLESHLASRIRQGFVVEEVVDELMILGHCIEQSAATADAKPAPSEVERLWNELHRAAAAITDMFVKHMAEDEQAEKRYLQRLQQWATTTLRESTRPLPERLKEALALVMTAMNARSAALLVYHPATDELVSAAAVGGEAMEGFVTSPDLLSFAGQVAANEETMAIEDVPTTALTIPESLRRSGIQSLLGVRLPVQRTLRGVLYIGVAEKRPFTARESRRLEAIGEQLAIHIDNAALFAQLTEKVAALSAERELRERFVSILAHDLRGPLSTAKLATNLLMTRARHLDEEEQTLAARIDRSLERTDRMVRDLLDANMIHAGERLSLELAECDLAIIVRDVVAELAAIHGDQFVVVTGQRVRGFWSADELRRAVWNLASNAAKYGAVGRPITIAVRCTSEGVALSVHNEGLPIPVDEQPHLHRQFARARAAKARRAMGWGLGLTLVHGCAAAHGGALKIRSDATAGTTFTLELPWDARSSQPSFEPLPPDSHPEPVPTHH